MIWLMSSKYPIPPFWLTDATCGRKSSKTVFGLAGTPAEWSSVSVLTRLHSELEKHEEWMQGNLEHGYNARAYMGIPLPQFMIIKKAPRLPEGKDVLTPEELEVIQYTKHLQTMLSIEVAVQDFNRLSALLRDFAMHQKLVSCLTDDAEIIQLVQSNNMEKNERVQFYRNLKAQMNWKYMNSTVIFSGVFNLYYPTVVEGTDPTLKVSSQDHSTLRNSQHSACRGWEAILRSNGVLW